MIRNDEYHGLTCRPLHSDVRNYNNNNNIIYDIILVHA